METKEINIKKKEKKTEEKKEKTEEKKEEIVRAKFFIPSIGKNKYLRLKVAPSLIKGAGQGVFTLDEIPYGSSAIYKGKRVPAKKEYKINDLYTWDVHQFDLHTGKKKSDKVIYFLDATDLKHSNWARYVNCGSTNDSNNVDPKEYFGNIYYIANRVIKPGEELYIDYGEEYRQHHLKLYGTY